MTRWCPACENPGIPVAKGSQPVAEDGMKLVSRDLPGIEPSHFCSRCPTFFRARDRFYLTAQHGLGVHGIAVWPHHERHLYIEVGERGLIATFHDGASMLIPGEDVNGIATDHFRSLSEEEIVKWASRRGFRLELVPTRNGIAELVVDRPGPHFVLVVAKAWFQSKDIRATEDALDWLESIGADPLLFPPVMMETG